MRLILPTNTTEGAVDLCGLWVTIHAVYRQWSLARINAPEREDISNHLKRQLKEFEAIPCAHWASLLKVQGVTPLGLAALSWTMDATLKDMMAIWGEIHHQAQDPPEGAWDGIYFMNPALLPTPSFKAFIETGFDKQSEWKFLSLIFKGRPIKGTGVSNLNPEIIGWFQVDDAS